MKNIILTSNIETFSEYTIIPLEKNKCKTLRGFYEEIADALEFPDYFGFNLDSLDELLNDLSWLEDEKIVVYVQDSEDFLLTERNPNKRSTVLDLIDATCEDWQWAEEDSDFPKKELKFVFNPSIHIRTILEKAEIEFDEI